MSEIVWNAGPPPHVGWWNASVNVGAWKSPIMDGDLKCWRWWNGESWGSMHLPGEYVDPDYIHRKWTFEEIFWNDSWPEGARVPRVRPRPAVVWHMPDDFTHVKWKGNLYCLADIKVQP